MSPIRYGTASSANSFAVTARVANEWLSPFELRLRDKAHQALGQMIPYQAWRGLPFLGKDVMIFYDEPAYSLGWPASEKRAAIQTLIQQELHRTDPTATLYVGS